MTTESTAGSERRGPRKRASRLDGLDTRKINHMGRQLVIRLNLLLRTSVIHEAHNEAMRRSVDFFQKSANELLGELEPIVLQGDQDQMYLCDFRLRGDTIFYANVKVVLEELKARASGGMTIYSELSREDVLGLIDVFHSYRRGEDPDEEPGFEAMNVALAEKNVSAVVFNPVLELGAGAGIDVRVAARSRPTIALKTYAKVLVAMNRASVQGGALKPIDRLKLNKNVQALVDLSHDDELFFSGLGSLKCDGDYSYFHPVHVAMLSIRIGKHIGLSKKQLMDLALSSLYYDIGRSKLGAHNFETSHSLSEEEWDVMRRHPLRSAREILRSQALNEAIHKRLLVAFEHHLNLTEGGYPQRIRHRKPHLFSRIVAVADAYDALTTTRPHRDGYLPDEALRIMLEQADKRFDRTLLKVLINILEIYPQGTPVLLDSGELATVLQNHSEEEFRHRPIVRIHANPAGEAVRPRRVDLLDQDSFGGYKRTIEKALDLDDPRSKTIENSMAFVEGESVGSDM